VIVLDYDYIGIEPKEYDLATFETSMFLKLIHRFNSQSKWTEIVQPVINEYYQLKIESPNDGIKMLVEILHKVNRDRDTYSYKSCLLIAYSRLLTSYVKVGKIKENSAIAATCIMIIGKLIGELYRELKTNNKTIDFTILEQDNE
jgi:hypothetical protein